MIASDELHRLIRSLSQSEKRFFKIYASRHVIGEGNNYVLLFDAIAKQRSYNEKALKEKFAGIPFMKRFAAVKNYLHQLIIRSMRNFHSASTIDIELKEMLIDIDFLYQKGLYKQCEKLHRKAEKLAVETDKKTRLLEILEWKARLLQVRNKDSEPERFHQSVFSEESRILDSIRLSLQLKSEVLDAFSLIRKKGFARSEKDLELMKDLLKKYGKLDYSKLTFNDKYYLNYIHTVYHTSSGDNKKSVMFTKRNIELLESIPFKLREEEFEKYLVTLNNMVVNCIHLQRINETGPYIRKIRSLATHNIRENILLWATSYKLVLGVSIRSADFEQAERIANEVISGINFYFDKIPATDIVTFKYNIAIVYFANGKYSKAIKALNEIINDNDNEYSLRDDIQSFARIIRLIVFWEKGEHEMLPYAALSAYRFLYKRKRLYKFENIVLQFIRKQLPLIDSGAKQASAFRELKKELELLVKDPLEKKALEYFDFITWIESKLDKKEFRVLSKEKISGSVN
jgi:hypothetical protein